MMRRSGLHVASSGVDAEHATSCRCGSRERGNARLSSCSAAQECTVTTQGLGRPVRSRSRRLVRVDTSDGSDGLAEDLPATDQRSDDEFAGTL